MPAKKSGKKRPPPRVPILAEESLTAAQRALLESIRSGPRGGGTGIRGPFAVFLHAPAFGELAQRLGGHCRFNVRVLGHHTSRCRAAYRRARKGQESTY